MPIPGLSDIFNRRPKSGGRWIKFTAMCAWCKRTLRRERIWRDEPGAADETSHGICPACERKHFPETDEKRT